MRYKPEHKETTRLKILGAAGRGFRSRGFAGIGVDAIAKAAGVTSGAFYSHFGSKAGAANAALVEGLDEVIRSIPVMRQEQGDAWIRSFSEYYLSPAHREDLTCGCAMATLTPEVARSEGKVKAAYADKMCVIVALIADGLAGGTESERRARAWSMLGTLIGGLNIVRAMGDTDAASTIAKSLIEAAVNVAGPAA